MMMYSYWILTILFFNDKHVATLLRHITRWHSQINLWHHSETVVTGKQKLTEIFTSLSIAVVI